MANNPSAKKRHRQSLERRARNKQRLARVRTAVKKVRAAAAQQGDTSGLLKVAERELRKAGSHGVMPSRTVDRTVSRLTRLVRG